MGVVKERDRSIISIVLPPLDFVEAVMSASSIADYQSEGGRTTFPRVALTSYFISVS